jgi:hypothetical protein
MAVSARWVSTSAGVLLIGAAGTAGCYDWTLPEGDTSGDGEGGQGATVTSGGGATTAVVSSASSGSGPAQGSGGAGSTSSSSASSSSSATTGGGTTHAQCEAEPTCDACIACSEGGPCSALAQACFANPECLAIYDCDCFDAQSCDDCIADHPQGQNDYHAASVCVLCDSCLDSCAPECRYL